MEIIGRIRERHVLTRCELSDKPEFIAVYGRRRIGKTFLITQHFGNRFAFSVTGISNGSMKDQLCEFHRSLTNHYRGDYRIPNNWFEAFAYLETELERDNTRVKKTIFFDELPWLDTHKSGFLAALEHFWNSFAARRPDIILIVCGSAASWMISNLIENYGGLHNRVTETIVLEPFTLSECEAFYTGKGVAFNRWQVAEAYMIFGGIPYYMESMDKMYGLVQNVDLLLYQKNAKLANEFNRLYHSLFRHAGNHINIVETLAKRGSAMTRRELSSASGISDGGGLTKILAELESCGLVGRIADFRMIADFRKSRNGDYYAITDFFTLYYFKYLKSPKNADPHFWTNYLTDPSHNTWCGYAFERLCMAHIEQIKQKLGISGVITNTGVFRSPGAQIDIVIDRRDDTINLCECKFYNKPYVITDQDVADLERKKEVFLAETRTKKSIHLTMITATGLAHNANRNYIQSEVTLDDLFIPLLF